MAGGIMGGNAQAKGLNRAQATISQGLHDTQDMRAETRDRRLDFQQRADDLLGTVQRDDIGQLPLQLSPEAQRANQLLGNQLAATGGVGSGLEAIGAAEIAKGDMRYEANRRRELNRYLLGYTTDEARGQLGLEASLLAGEQGIRGNLAGLKAQEGAVRGATINSAFGTAGQFAQMLGMGAYANGGMLNAGNYQGMMMPYPQPPMASILTQPTAPQAGWPTSMPGFSPQLLMGAVP